LNVNSAVSLELINASDAAFEVQRPSATRDGNSTAAEKVVTGLGIDHYDVAGIGLILQAETERTQRERALSSIARSIGCRAGHSSCAYREA